MSSQRGDPLDQGTVGSIRLAMRVVEYPDAPDRCTVYPPELSDHDRMTHWLSADREAFVPLDCQR